MKRTLVTSLLLVYLAAAPGAWGQGKSIGTFGDWNAFRDTEDGRPLCYIGSTPKSARGDYTSRGEVYVLVTLRPAEKPHGVVSIEAGYPYSDDGTVEVDIDGEARFDLFTRNREDGKGDAWANTDEDDEALIVAMKAGRQMVVKGTSKRGTLTTDTYSLSGFTRAHRAMEDACKP